MSTIWRERAACRGLDTDLFYPPHGMRGRARDEWVARAVSICQSCPVAGQCYAEAATQPDRWGVWGGQLMDTPRRDTPEPRACRHCHQPFTPQHGGQRYCGDECRDTAARRVGKASRDRKRVAA